MSRVHACVKAMSQGLGDKPYCAGNHLSLADVAVGCALGYLDLRFEGRWRDGHPALVAWLDRFSAAVPAFEATRVAA